MIAFNIIEFCISFSMYGIFIVGIGNLFIGAAIMTGFINPPTWVTGLIVASMGLTLLIVFEGMRHKRKHRV